MQVINDANERGISGLEEYKLQLESSENIFSGS